VGSDVAKGHQPGTRKARFESHWQQGGKSGAIVKHVTENPDGYPLAKAMDGMPVGKDFTMGSVRLHRGKPRVGD